METFKWLFGRQDVKKSEVALEAPSPPIDNVKPVEPDLVNIEPNRVPMIDDNLIHAMDHFQLMDKIMQGFMNNFVTHEVYYEDVEPPAPLSPRDQLLKHPDSIIENQQYQDLRGSGHQSIRLSDPFMNVFSNFDEIFGMPHHNTIQESPRKSFLKKEVDGDDGDDGVMLASPTNNVLQENAPSVLSYSRMSSYSRIVKPDGSVEERKTYKDSTGKEEVTVTKLDPSEASKLLEESAIRLPPELGRFPFKGIFW